ncbi:MAG TPA: crosslink repair DNA glycosylase YcaQ family protein [Ktedonobacteraceae bacterium]
MPISDWPARALIRERYQPYHDREILLNEAEVVAEMLALLDERGPLSSQEFEQKPAPEDPDPTYRSWYGATQARRIMRSLWARGDLVTHHRRNGRHYYDRAQRVIPEQYFNQPPQLDEAEYFRWIYARRYQAVGLLRPNAESAIWSVCGGAEQRRRALAELVEEGTLVPVQVGAEKPLYYAHAAALKSLDQPELEPRIIFLGPLDSLLWDRKGVQQIFGFDYVWEVYKPEPVRKWGYYVLPVFYGDRFVARVDSRLEKGTWTLARWWWEDEIVLDGQLLDALRAAFERFASYLGAVEVRTSESMDAAVQRVVAGLTRV